MLGQVSINSAEFKHNLPPVFWEDGGLHEAAVRGGEADVCR